MKLSTVLIAIILSLSSSYSFAQNLQDSLFAHYLLDGNALDATGNGNNGTVYGATLTSDRFGTPNSAYDFDGWNDIIRVSNLNNGVQPATDYLTATCWFKINNAKTGVIMSYSTTCSSVSDDYLEIALTYVNGFSDIYGKFFNHNPWVIFDDQLVTDGQWHFLVYTYDNGDAKFYLDGQMVSNVTVNHPPTNFTYNSSVDYTIGGSHVNSCSHNNHFDGVIDDVRLYVRALSSSEVSQLYHQSFPNFSYSMDCNPVVQFTNQSINATSYEWNFGDGNTSTLASPQHQYTSSGTYIVTLKSFNNGYSFSYIDTITVVNDAPVADFLAPNHSIVNLAISITDISTSLSQIISWDWNFGNGTTSTQQHPSITYTQAGTYPITLIVTNLQGCSDTLTQNIIINPENAPYADFNHSAEINPCDLEVTFTNISAHLNVFEWDFGDGFTSNETSPTHTYASGGTYFVTLTGIKDSTQFTFTQLLFLEAVIADFNAPIEAVIDANVQFIDNSSSNVNQWNWDFGNGDWSSEQNPITIFTQEGNFNVVLIAHSDNCEDTIVKAIQIFEQPHLQVPNAFTPNGDNVNDYFKVLSNNQFYEILTFNVYSRWGNLVFNSTNPNGWNGHANGKLMPQDTYVYYIEIQLENDEIFRLKGEVLLIR